jgi:nicotinamide-nucleotide amidase
MRQAFLPEGAEALDNPYGTAPGIWLVRGGVAFAALPGPPREFTPMLEGPLRTRLSALGGTPLHTVVLRAAAVAESVVEGLLGDLVRDSLVTAATYAKTDEVHVRLASKDPEALRATADEARRRLSPHVYGSGRETLAETVVSALRGRRQTLATAESCTGGLIGARLTDVPGASEAFLGGIVAYSNGAKQALLGVPSELLAQHGAVSAECAEAMAVGARKSLGSDWALSVTGIAGPGGGSDEKPVGLVWHGLAGPDGASSHKAVFGGGRDQVRARASALALELLRRKLGG